MKKILRNVLVLALGLTTTIATAQIGASNTTWIDNSDSDARDGNSRTTITADWGGVHVSSDWNYSFNSDSATSGLSLYEAYASTDLMGFGTLTMGQQDLSYGSGSLIGSNGGVVSTRNTTQGVNLNMSLAGLNITAGMLDLNNNTTYMNASGSFAGADINVLMMNKEDGSKAHAYDLSYGMGDFSVGASMNSDFDGDEMTSYSVTYSGIDNLGISVAQTEMKADNGGVFNSDYSAVNGGFAYGAGPVLASGDKNTSMGIAYNLGDISIGYTRHSIANDANADDVEANQMTLGYQLNGNAGLSVSRWDDGNGSESTWLTVTITP